MPPVSADDPGGNTPGVSALYLQSVSPRPGMAGTFAGVGRVACDLVSYALYARDARSFRRLARCASTSATDGKPAEPHHGPVGQHRTGGQQLGSDIVSLRTLGFRTHRCCLMVLAGGLLLLTGGCPVDVDKLSVALLQAGLDSVTGSLIEALQTYLAGN